MNQPVIDKELEALAAAKIERDKLCEECFQLRNKVSRKPCCLKLLQFGRE